MITERKYDGDNIVGDMSKRFWLVGIDDYYPGGFLNDVICTGDNMDEIENFANEKQRSKHDIEFVWDNVEFKELEITKR
jgi:hypothetical protein